MKQIVEVDVWIRGRQHATTHRISGVPSEPGSWSEAEVKRLLSEMLLALDHDRNPGGVAPEVTLRGFSWIVSPDQEGGVILHLELQSGTASAGPLAVDEPRLTSLISRVMATTPRPTANHSIH